MIDDKSVLKSEYDDQLYDYQKDRIRMIFQEFVDLNVHSSTHTISYCPKCGTENPVLTKGGHTQGKNPKQMVRCMSCGKRFVETTGTLSFYSHQNESKWCDFIKATMEKKPISECAALINVHERTAFRMRHKLMQFLAEAARKELEEHPLSGTVEIDEIYFRESHKGLKPKKIADLEDLLYVMEREYSDEGLPEDLIPEYYEISQKLDQYREEEKETKRGISDEKACVLTGVERQGNASIMATNMAKPSSDDIRKISDTIMDESYVFLDGHKPYIPVLNEKNCPYKVCLSDESYDAVNHLNNVNSLHSRMRDWLHKTYHGVSTIYLNRYAALMHYAHQLCSCDAQEKTLMLLKVLGKIQFYFFGREIQVKGIFNDPLVMSHRRDMVSEFDQREHRRELLTDRFIFPVFKTQRS